MERRKPTYGSAVRMAQLVFMLAQAWRPMSREQIGRTLGVSERTLQRYRKAMNEMLTSDDGGDFLRVIKDGKQEKWYLADQEGVFSGNYFKIVSVMVAKVLFKSFEGTVLESGIEQALSLFEGHLPPSKKEQLKLFDRKIRYSGFGRKNYSEYDEILAYLLRGLIYQKKLKIRHYSYKASKEKSHVIRPYTLLLHRDSLYLYAYVEGYKEIRTFGVDRIKDVSLLNEDFKYPANFDPDKMANSSFGIFDEPGTKPQKVVVYFKEILHEYITTRLWHSTQKFSKLKGGGFEMAVHLTNTHEFIPWFLQFGSDARVLEPESLEEKIKKELRSALDNY